MTRYIFVLSIFLFVGTIHGSDDKWDGYRYSGRDRNKDDDFRALLQEDEKITAPAGLSLPEAFRALYNAAQHQDIPHHAPLPSKPIGDDNDAMQVLLSRCDGTRIYCGMVREKFMNISFDKYPKLSVGYYNKNQGVGKAQKVLQEAADAHHVSARSAAPIFSTEACDYFGNLQSPDELASDLRSTFKRCKDFEKSQQELAAHKEASAKRSWKKLILSRCTVSYALRDENCYKVSHSRPCDQALDHIQHVDDSLASNAIEELRVCTTTRIKIDSDTKTFGQCIQLNQAATMHVAAELIKHEMSTD